MKLYLYSTAIVKLIQKETESAALAGYLAHHGGDSPVTSSLAAG